MALRNDSLVIGDLEPRLSGPYIDFREMDLSGDGRRDLISSYGGVWLAPGGEPAQPGGGKPKER
jgi:hypothetical protein